MLEPIYSEDEIAQAWMRERPILMRYNSELVDVVITHRTSPSPNLAGNGHLADDASVQLTWTATPLHGGLTLSATSR